MTFCICMARMTSAGFSVEFWGSSGAGSMLQNASRATSLPDCVRMVRTRSGSLFGQGGSSKVTQFPLPLLVAMQVVEYETLYLGAVLVTLEPAVLRLAVCSFEFARFG